jgi:hypothetical protein
VCALDRRLERILELPEISERGFEHQSSLFFFEIPDAKQAAQRA